MSVAQTALLPDAGQIERFVSSLFRYCDDGTFVNLRAFDQFDIGKPALFTDAVPVNNRRHLIDRAVKAAGKAANADAPAVFAPPVATFKTRANARADNLANGPTLAVELDCGNTGEKRRKLEAILGPVTVCMASGSEWADPNTGEIFPKVHLHWRLSEPTREAAEHASLRDARWLAAVLVGADHTAVPPVHPLRWAGSWNQKSNARLATITVENPDAEIHLVDAIAGLQEAVEAAGLASDSTGTERTPSEPQAPISKIASALAAMPNNAEWDEWNRIGMAAWRATGGCTEGLHAWANWSAKSPKHDEVNCAARWEHYASSPPQRIGAGTILHLARIAGWRHANETSRRHEDDIPPPDGREECGEEDRDTSEPSSNGKNAKPKSGTLYVLTPAACVIAPMRSYVVKGLVSSGDHCAIIGLPGSGKSILAPYIGYRTSLGLDVFGHRTKPVVVLYLAAEDGTGMTMRVRALHDRMGNSPNFLLQPVPMDLMTPGSPHVADVEKLIQDHQPGLVILDTVARAFPGLRENDPDGMSYVVKTARGFAAICNSAVASIHHPPKAGEKTPRGHSNFNGDLDMTLYLEGTGREPRHVSMGKNRNGPSDLFFSFNLGVQDFGRDADGDLVTAPVAEPVEGPNRPKAKLTATERNAVTFLADLLCEEGKPLPPQPGFPNHLHGVDEGRWRDECERRRLSTAETTKDRGRVFRKVSGDLRNKGTVGMCDGIVWLISPGEGGIRGSTYRG